MNSPTTWPSKSFGRTLQGLDGLDGQLVRVRRCNIRRHFYRLYLKLKVQARSP